MEFTFDTLSFSIGFIIAAIVGVLAYIMARKEVSSARHNESLMLSQFDSLAKTSLSDAQENLLNLASERFKNMQADVLHEAERRQNNFSELIKPIQRNLTELDQRIVNLDKTGAGLSEHLNLMALNQTKLQDETAQLVAALRAPNIRGRWGEMQLQRALEAAGFVEGTHFETQITRKAKDGRDIRPDFLVYLPDNKELINDSKTPIEGYLDALKEGISQAEQQTALTRHAKALRAHVVELGKRAYWEEFNGLDFVVLFIPGEGMLSAALSQDVALMEDAAKARVMLASPLSLLGLLRVIAYGFQQAQLADEAHRIAAEGSTLVERIAGFVGHLDKLGRQIDTVNKTYDNAVGSLEKRVLPSARKMQDMGISGKTDIPAEIEPINKITRKPQEMEDDIKKVAND